MKTYLLAFLSSLVFVGLKSTQQLNVVNKQYLWILPTSLFMAATEVYCVATVAKTGYGFIVLAIGMGAGIGATIATYLHSKFLKE